MRLTFEMDFFLYNVVSIHASVKDATLELPNGVYTAIVSIHASVKDATPCL